jgi:hypothetical protein
LADYCGAKELIYDEIIEKPKASIWTEMLLLMFYFVDFVVVIMLML